MAHQVLELRTPGIARVKRTLHEYLPGLSLGLVALAPRRVLVPASTIRALRTEYGSAALPAVLARAGAAGSHEVGDAGAIALLRARDLEALPALPAAPAVGLDWHLQLTRVPEAWALLGGPDAVAWGGVRVGHIDTGYTEHPVFGFGSTTWIDRTLGQTFFASGTPMDDPGPGGGIDPLAASMDGHGTRTASVLAGWAPDAQGGAFYGVAPKVPLVPVRIANHVWINHAQREFAQAVNHLVDHAQVGVISLSMGIFGASILKTLREALNRAYDAGVIVVCAAGNRVEPVVAPARLARTIAVAGVDAQRVPWGGSSCGPEVDFSGPAEDIRRAEWDKKTKPRYRGGGDGTSYATAITAGAAALWLAHRGAEISAAYPQRWQRVEAFKALASSTAVPGPNWQGGSFGAGVLDVRALLDAPLPTPAAQPDVPA